MDGNNHQGYLQDDVNYEDLINNAGWPSSGDQYQYQQTHPAQDAYQQYQPTQPVFDPYGLPPQSAVTYTSSFSNPTYSSQYQHARPSDVFGSASYPVDPSLQPYQPHGSSYSFPPQDNAATISPHNLEYGDLSNQPVNRGTTNSMFQQASNNYNPRSLEQPVLFNGTPNGHILNMTTTSPYSNLSQSSTEQDSQPIIPRKFDIMIPAESTPRTFPTKTEEVAQESLRITHPELLKGNKTSSQSHLAHAPFLTWEDTPVEVALGLKNTIPKYHPRKSKSGRDIIVGYDVLKLSAPAKPSTKTKIRVPKEPKTAVSKYKGTSQAPKQASRVANLRDGASFNSTKSPTPTETSSSEEESSSDEDSESEDDAPMPVKLITEVRSATRPTDIISATRWDAIGIVWKDPNSSPPNDVVKSAIEEYGDMVTSLRVQLKTNAVKTLEAASNPAESSRLASERTILLSQLYETIKAALDEGYSSIVDNLGNHQKLVVGLTTTLMDCIKANNYLGELPRAIFKLLARFQTLSDELLKKIKFDGIQKRWTKKADEKIKKDIASILANTIESKEKASKAKKEAAHVDENKKFLEKIDQSKARMAENHKIAASLTSAKRAHEGDSSIAKPNKKFASDIAGAPSSATSKPVLSKRPTNLLANNLLGITSKPPPKPAPKKREPPPPSESRLSSILADIAKPPEPPRVPQAPTRPPETPEEKKLRERKESRRHLRVRFKDGTELEQIRLFKHEEAEDEGRQDDMLRDAHDDRSEGMMHKMRVSENMDLGLEDDEAVALDIKDRPYPNLISVEMSDVNKVTQRGAFYTTRGGEKTFNTNEQQTQQRREALELMVVYTNPEDIPSSPKEPTQIESSRVDQEHQLKGPTDAWVVERLQALEQHGPEYTSRLFASRIQQHRLGDIHQDNLHGAAKSVTRFTQPLFDANTNTNVNIMADQHRKPHTLTAEQLQSLQRISDSLKGKPYPPDQPPDWYRSEASKAAWWEGYNRDKAAKEKQAVDLQMAQMPAAPYQPPATQYTAPVSAPQYQYPAPAPQYLTLAPEISTVAAQVPDLTHLLSLAPASDQAPPVSTASQQIQNSHVSSYQAPASFAQAQQYPYSTAPQLDLSQLQAYLGSVSNAENGQGSSHQNAALSGWPNADSRSSEYANNGQQSRRDGEWDNDKRSRSKQNQDANNLNSKSRGYETKKWNGFGNEGPLDANGEYKGKKKPCKFWQQGKCAKGSKCTFLHGEE